MTSRNGEIMNETKQKKVSVFTILIFVLCALLLAYMIFAIIGTAKYIGSMIDYGQITISDNFFDIATYFMTNCGSYLIYIFILLSIWWVGHRVLQINSPKVKPDSVETKGEFLESIEETHPPMIDEKGATIETEETKDNFSDAINTLKKENTVTDEKKTDTPK